MDMTLTEMEPKTPFDLSSDEILYFEQLGFDQFLNDEEELYCSTQYNYVEQFNEIPINTVDMHTPHNGVSGECGESAVAPEELVAPPCTDCAATLAKIHNTLDNITKQ